jgi:hypothetical protein
MILAVNEARCRPPLDEAEVLRIAGGKREIVPNVLSHNPTPLVRPIAAPEEYPLDALGPILGPAAHALAEIVQVPGALAANCVLAASALAAQTCSDVETLAGQRPLSLFLLTIAGSGDRKTTTDRIALASVHEHIKVLTKTYIDAREQAAERTGGEESGALLEPRKPWLICTAPTIEGLIISFIEGQYGQGVFSDEGGAFIGGHALREDTELGTIATLSRFWDGSAVERVRATLREHAILYGRRLSMHLMAQPSVASNVLASRLFRSQGHLARWLMVAPESLAGTRLHDPKVPAPHAEARLVRYQEAIKALMERPIVVCARVGGLKLGCLSLSTGARKALVVAYDEFERDQALGHRLELARDWASKAAEHACRIAGVMALLENPRATCVSATCMRNALVLTRHYLGEFVRLVGAANISEEMDQAEKLRQWLIRRGRDRVKVRDIVQRGPNWIREAKRAKAVLTVLVEFHWLRIEGSEYVLHSSMLGSGARS